MKYVAVPDAWERFESSDLDEVHAVYRTYGHHRRECLGKTPFHVCLRWMNFSRAAIGVVVSQSRQRVDAAAGGYLLHIPAGCVATYRVGSQYVEATPDRPVLIAPHTEYTVFNGNDVQVMAFFLPGDRSIPGFDLVLDSIPEQQIRQVLCTPESLIQLQGLLSRAFLLQALAQPQTLSVQLEIDIWEWLADRFESPASTRTQWSARNRLNRVENWIESHLDEPLSLQHLASMAGVTPRGLHQAFLKRHGLSPMRWLAEQRMAAARTRLLEPTGHERVIDIAHDCGFVHLARFASYYRARYGELPSITLQG
ncbi:MAG: helix-turn-helix domain-containing protein [Rhodoferax sp.]